MSISHRSSIGCCFSSVWWMFTQHGWHYRFVHCLSSLSSLGSTPVIHVAMGPSIWYVRNFTCYLDTPTPFLHALCCDKGSFAFGHYIWATVIWCSGFAVFFH